MRIGGVSQDIPDEFLPALRKFIPHMRSRINEYDWLLKENEILLARAKGVGVLPRETAISIGASGPVLRSCGVKWDIRKADPYSLYDRFEFDIPTGEIGDCYDRYRVRVEEMRQSLRIIEQAIEQIPAGEIRSDVPQLIRPPVGEAYAHVEGATGEVGFHVVSDGSIAPYRCHIRAPSLMNLTALKDMIVGWKIQDLILIFGSFAITMGEVDR
jgi:NADH-quinone oxidoreductase subunit D